MTSSSMRHRAALALVTAVAAFGVTACGGDDESGTDTASTGASSADTGSGGGSVVEAAQAKLEGHTKADKIGPTKPIEKTIPKGKNVIYVDCGQQACTNVGDGFKEAAKTLGWNVENVQSGPTPEAIQASFDEVIRRKPDAVVSAGFGSQLYPKQLAELNKLKIPVLSVAGTDESGENGVLFEPVGPKKAGEGTALAADKTIVDIGGKGEVGTVLLGGYPIIEKYTKSYEAEIKSACSECTVKTLPMQPTSIGKDAPQKIANFLRANPKIKALFLSYDALGTGLDAAIKGAGVETPKTYSWAVDQPGLKALADGERTAAAIMPYPELGWQVADALARTFTGGDVADSQTLQTLTVNGKDLNNVPTKLQPFPGMVVDYRDQFKALWGMQ